MCEEWRINCRGSPGRKCLDGCPGKSGRRRLMTIWRCCCWQRKASGRMGHLLCKKKKLHRMTQGVVPLLGNIKTGDKTIAAKFTVVRVITLSLRPSSRTTMVHRLFAFIVNLQEVNCTCQLFLLHLTAPEIVSTRRNCSGRCQWTLRACCQIDFSI